MLGEGVVRPPFFSISGQFSSKLAAKLQDRFKRWFGTKKRGIYSIANEVEEMDKYWEDLIYLVCGGHVCDMSALKKYDIIDFFNYVENKSKK